MSRMSDREAWISVFNTALTAAMTYRGPVTINGKEVSALEYARAIADEALKYAPKDEA